MRASELYPHNWMRMQTALKLAVLTLIAYPVCIRAQALKNAASALNQGNTSEAERLVRSELSQHKDESVALSLLAVILDEEKRYPEAEETYRRAISLSKPSSSLLNNYGNHLLAIGELDRARIEFEKVIVLSPTHENANLQLAKIAIHARRYSASLAYLDRLSAEQQVSGPVKLLRLQALYGTHNDLEAAALLNQLADESKGNGGADASIGLALDEVGEYEKAEQFLSLALEVAPSDFDVLYNLGITAFRAGHIKRSQQVLEAALRQKPKDVDVLYNLGLVYAEMNRKDAALSEFAQAARIDPNRPDIQMLVAHTSSDLGYDVDALDAWDRYLKLKPEDDIARRERAFTAAILGQYDQSIPELQKFTRKYPSDAIGHYELASAETLANPTDAGAEFDKALAIKPDFVAALTDRGLLNYQMGDLPAAQRDLEVANKILPNSAVILDRLGEVYLADGRTGDAVAALRSAVSAAPSNSPILFHYARALSRSGDQDKANQVMARFRELGPAVSRRRGGLVELMSLMPEERYANFRARIEKAAKDNPSDMSIEVQYLKILLADARDGEAKIVADKIKSSNPNAAVLVAAGRILLEYDQYPAAKQMLEAADTANGSVNVKLDLAIAEFHIHGPSSGFNALNAVPAAERTGDYYLARAEMLDAAGRFPEAVADLNQALREAPKRPQFYRDAVFFLIKNDRAPEAINLLDQAVRIAPYDPEILLLKATTLELAKKTEESERLLDQIESRWPEWYNVWLTHGIILETYKRYDEARQMIETAVALGARTSETYFYLSESTYYSAPDKLDAAEAAIKTALELAPQDPWSRALAGRIALDKHDYAEAIDQLQKAVKLAPHLVQAHYYMSQAYKALGNTTQAQAELKEVALINKDFPNAGNEVGDLRERLFSVKAPQN